MTKAVFTTKISPVYDDLPEVRYHFPKTYLQQVSAAVGDWIVYYEPRRSTGDLSSKGGRQVYFATARVERIIADPARSNHYYAEVSNYLRFVRRVPFKEDSHYYEGSLGKGDGSTNKGAFGRAVRNLKDVEFDLIWNAGLDTFLASRKEPGLNQMCQKNQCTESKVFLQDSQSLPSMFRWSKIVGSSSSLYRDHSEIRHSQ